MAGFLKTRMVTRSSGTFTFALLLGLAAGLFLVLLPDQTVTLAKGGFWVQPWFWPAVGLSIILAGSVLALLVQPKKLALPPLADLLVLEFPLWFLAYVWCVPKIGYLPATLGLFVLGSIRLGYRSRLMLGIAVGLSVLVVFVFKTALGVNIPGGALYEYLPGGLRNFAILHL